MAKVYVVFPKTGLGNLLLIWARAKVFAKINDLSLVTSSWWGIRWGAWLRSEQKKRVYWGYFNESSWLERLRALIWLRSKKVISNPPLTRFRTNRDENSTLYLFKEVVTSNDLFYGLRDHRDFLLEEILKLLKPQLKTKLNYYQVPAISVHIRRGDFKISNSITAISFFIHAVREIRKVVNEQWPVTVFTDAEIYEIEEILNEPGVTLAKPKADILDILLMSKSKVIVLSQSSTFSYWSAFLSDSVILINHNDWQKTITDDFSREFRITDNASFNQIPGLNEALLSRK